MLLLSFYSVIPAFPLTAATVGLTDLGTTTSQTINYNYYVDQGSLSEIAFVIFVQTQDPFPANYVNYGLTLSTDYLSNLLAANTAHPDGYIAGFNDKCLLGMTSIIQSFDFALSYDMDNLPSPSSNIVCTGGDCSTSMFAFCLIQLYDCSLIDANCKICISYSLC